MFLQTKRTKIEREQKFLHGLFLEALSKKAINCSLLAGCGQNVAIFTLAFPAKQVHTSAAKPLKLLGPLVGYLLLTR